MCGRYTLLTSVETIADLFSGLKIPSLTPAYNIAPTEQVPVVRAGPGGEHECVLLRWGLIPSWSADSKIGSRMINARAETICEKPAFRDLIGRRRCLVLADGFYEWEKTAAGKQPWHIHMKSRRPFCFAGLWDDNRKLAPPVQSVTIITTTPNDLVSPIHDRMPAILPESKYDLWLDRDFQNTDELRRILAPFPADEMQTTPVSPKVNRATYKEANCVEPIRQLF